MISAANGIYSPGFIRCIWLVPEMTEAGGGWNYITHTRVACIKDVIKQSVQATRVNHSSNGFLCAVSLQNVIQPINQSLLHLRIGFTIVCLRSTGIRRFTGDGILSAMGNGFVLQIG
jgi:hypothetical protein